MLRRLRPLLTYANVMATIAVFLGLGGSAYAINEWNSSNIQDNTLTGADIKGKASPGFVDGSLDTYDIKNGGLLSSDLAANTLTAGQLAPNSASTSEIKDNSVTPAKLAPSEAVHELTGASHFDNCSTEVGAFCADPNISVLWTNVGSPYANVGYYKDPLGIVHLQGSAQAVGGGSFSGVPPPIFVLPTAYRPSATRSFVVRSDANSSHFDWLTIASNGQVNESNPQAVPSNMSLDGIDFRP
jgi:hypothetical protein